MDGVIKLEAGTNYCAGFILTLTKCGRMATNRQSHVSKIHEYKGKQKSRVQRHPIEWKVLSLQMPD